MRGCRHSDPYRMIRKSNLLPECLPLDRLLLAFDVRMRYPGHHRVLIPMGTVSVILFTYVQMTTEQA